MDITLIDNLDKEILFWSLFFIFLTFWEWWDVNKRNKEKPTNYELKIFSYIFISMLCLFIVIFSYFQKLDINIFDKIKLFFGVN